MARVMVTGASGYIGNVLVDHLLKENHQVVAVDWMIFGAFPLKPFHDNPNFELLHQDIREIPVRSFRGVDLICDVSGLPNEQTCALDPVLAREINVEARARIARIAKAMGVRRHIALTSSETVAGSKSVYARCNRKLEEAILAASDDGFCTTILRAGSVYGLSRRMRFDVIANVAALHAHMGRRLTLPGSSQLTLPFIHVRDVARAVLSTIDAPTEEVAGNLFALGSQTLSMAELMEQAQQTFPEKLDYVFSRRDETAPEITVSLDEFQESTGFSPRITLDQGLLEVFIALKGGRTQLGETTNTARFYRALINRSEQNRAHRS